MEKVKKLKSSLEISYHLKSKFQENSFYLSYPDSKF